MRAKPSDAKLIILFLDMLAAEQGAGDNTLQAYRRDLADFSEFLGHAGVTFVAADTPCIRPIGRPRKIVKPAIAPRMSVWAVLIRSL